MRRSRHGGKNIQTSFASVRANNSKIRNDKKRERAKIDGRLGKMMQGKKLRSYRGQPLSLLLRIAVSLSAFVTAAIVLLVVGFILWQGVPKLAMPGLFAWEYDGENLSMLPALINTVSMVVLTLLLAVPVGVAAAVFLTEYSKKGSRLVKLIRLATETLSGIPSIVYGLFGFLLFVISLGWGYTLLAGVITMAIMILPLIIRTTEEALLSVPDSFREGSFGLGAGKLRTLFHIVLPSAVPGILAGMILAVGRIVGESAALIFTSGTNPVAATSLFSSASTLSVHLYALLTEGLYTEQAYAVATVLLFLVVGINALSSYAAKKLSAK